ncbi:MAG: Rpn family recombination-promoting nuclease/putative transposase, partial [Spirochaetaceae bacterium]|nr:Rpn family recombination-promoting nuclease/putative transposase [Spirochaetaceae bacterium]
DLLLHVKPSNAPAFAVFILFEHKSYPDRWVGLQMLRYVVAIWQRQRSRGPHRGRLEEIVPVVVYHGSRQWRRSLQVADLVTTDHATAAHVPHFEPIRVNLADLPEEQLQGSIRTITGLVFLKYIKQRITVRVARTLLEVMRRAVEDPNAGELAAICYQVYVQVKERREMELLETLARENRYAEVREDVMTYAEELLQEGLQQGRQEGLQDKQHVLIRQIGRRFGLSDSERKRIESCEDRDALDLALDEVVVADSKEAVLAKLN